MSASHPDTTQPAANPSGRWFQRIVTIAITALIMLLVYNHEQSRMREADMNRRIRTLADAYNSQRGTRRELYYARLQIERLKAELRVRGGLAEIDENRPGPLP